MDCTGLEVQGGRLRATRSCYGGAARAEHTWSTNPQIATVKAKAFDPTEADGSRTGAVNAVSAKGDAKVQVLSVDKAEAEGVKLEDAEVVVSGGRGLGDAGGFGVLEQLAGTMKQAAVGASRAACDLGWYPPSQQVGLTGKVVSPNHYIAVAISGASQHMAGMGGSKNIVAINRDPDANMVKVSRFAIIDDYRKVVPALIEEIKKLP
jgi:electron transfer flavoprotein alpha subunit